MLALDMRLQRIAEPEPEPSVAAPAATPDESVDAPAEEQPVVESESALPEEPIMAEPAAAEPPLPTLYFRWRG